MEPEGETLEAFGNWLLSLPRSVKVERMEMDYVPEENWAQPDGDENTSSEAQ